MCSGGDGFRVHFRRLSDARPHPQAKQPFVDYALRNAKGDPIPYIYASVIIQIVGTHVVILFRTLLDQRRHADTLAVWDHSTGEMKGVRFVSL